MPEYTSANRQIAYENLLHLRKGRHITAQVYQQKKAVIDRREAKAEALYQQKQRENEARFQARKKATAERNNIKKAFTAGLKTKKPFALDISVVDEKLGFQKFVDLITKSKKNLKMTINGTTWVLNDNTKHQLLRIVKDEITDYDLHEESWGALVGVIHKYALSGDITIEEQVKKHKNKVETGAFFKYTHNTICDLKKYGVYKTGEPQDHTETCLLVALKEGGLEPEKLNMLKIMVRNRMIPQSKLNQICDLVKIQIVLKKDHEKQSKIVYGKQYERVFHIGILDDHYFLVEPTQITSFCLNNYDAVKDIKDFHKIYKMQDGYYKKSNDRYITSFEVIKILLNTPALINEMSMDDRLIASTQFYDSISPEIYSLEYEADKSARPIKSKQEKDTIKYDNVVFDFETYLKKIPVMQGDVIKKDQNGNDIYQHVHTPYLVRTYSDRQNKVFYGPTCGLQMLCNLSKNTRLIAHNATYDYRFLIQHLWNITELSRGNRLISLSAKFGSANKHIHIQIKDSLHLISEPLRKFPKMFGLKCVKEVMPYSLYTEETIEKKYMNINYVLENFIEQHDRDQFLDNIKRWTLQKGDEYDIVEYSSKYCELDCKILWEGYNKFRGWMLECVDIDIDHKLTIASLAHTYFINEGCYDDVMEIGGIPQLFIQGCVVGGRTMCANNEKIMINEMVNDFDAVSLYPSAMARMQGFLKGLPKVIPAEGLDFAWLQKQDGYFVDIVVKSVGIHRAFPLLSAKNDDSVRMFSNEMIGKTVRVDKIMLEDLIEFQNVEFDVVRGYYFNDGFNTKVCETIKYLFNERLNKKKDKNPAEVIYKLIMNSSYGKSIMKPVESESRWFDKDHDFDVFLSRQYNWCTSYSKVGSKTKVKMVKTLIDHFNIAQVGVSILSMSKRIMNEVMCLAEDKGLQIYYQDTDSMHLKDCDIKPLSDAFTEKYGRQLIGKNMGQFHSDFDIKYKENGVEHECTNVMARRSIFLGKKSYIDELVGTNHKGEQVIDYHIRMKGIPNPCLKYAVNQNNLQNIFDLYVDLYNKKKYEIDLTNNGEKANFKYNPDYSCHTLSIFKRTISF
jgi:hypothetical protein